MTEILALRLIMRWLFDDSHARRLVVYDPHFRLDMRRTRRGSNRRRRREPNRRGPRGVRREGVPLVLHPALRGWRAHVAHESVGLRRHRAWGGDHGRGRRHGGWARLAAGSAAAGSVTGRQGFQPNLSRWRHVREHQRDGDVPRRRDAQLVRGSVLGQHDAEVPAGDRMPIEPDLGAVGCDAGG